MMQPTTVGTSFDEYGDPIVEFEEEGYIDMLSMQLPGMRQRVRTPCKCNFEFFLAGVIAHLNDKEDWTRERIADWIETLDIDTEFK